MELKKPIYNGYIPMNILHFGSRITSIRHHEISYQQNIDGQVKNGIFFICTISDFFIFIGWIKNFHLYCSMILHLFKEIAHFFISFGRIKKVNPCTSYSWRQNFMTSNREISIPCMCHDWKIKFLGACFKDATQGVMQYNCHNLHVVAENPM